VIIGLLPTISDHLQMTISTTGLIVTAYALGIAIGDPLLTTIGGRLPRKRLPLLLMALFVAGYLVYALAPSFGVLIVAVSAALALLAAAGERSGAPAEGVAA
jgi:DHA1 family inner membrane transport protein